jgi:hypothetical protein
MNLEERVKTLEDLVQRITQAFYSPPTVKPAPPQSATSKSGCFKDETIKYTLAVLDGSIKPIHYINDTALFGRINDDLKNHGYTWISAGRESRWQKE